MRGFYIYRDVWNPHLGEELLTKQENGNPKDDYAVAVVKDDMVVGQVPRELSRIFWHFIQHGG